MIRSFMNNAEEAGRMILGAALVGFGLTVGALLAVQLLGVSIRATVTDPAEAASAAARPTETEPATAEGRRM